MSLKDEYIRFSGKKASTMETVAWLAVQGHKAYKKLLQNIPFNSLECVKTTSVAELENQEAAPAPKKSYNNKEYQFIRYAESSGRVIDNIDNNSSFTEFSNCLGDIQTLGKSCKGNHLDIIVVPNIEDLDGYLDALRKRNPQGTADSYEEYKQYVDNLENLFVSESRQLIPGQMNPIQFGIMMSFGSPGHMMALYFNMGSLPKVYQSTSGKKWKYLCDLSDTDLFDKLEAIANRFDPELNKAL